QIGDDASVGNIEVASVDAPRFPRLDDPGSVLGGALMPRKRLARILQESREIRLEPVAHLRAVAEIAARLAVDPFAQVDPLADLVRPLAVPGQIFGKMPVALGGIEAETLEHIDPELLLFPIDQMALEGRNQLVLADFPPVCAEVDIPGLMIDAAADIVELLVLDAEDLRDLAGAMLHSMAQANRFDAAILV